MTTEPATIDTDATEEPTPAPPIPGSVYAVLARFADQTDDRPVLASVSVRPDHAAAADGFRLAVVHGSNELAVADGVPYEGPTPLRVLLPRSYFAKAWAKVATRLRLRVSAPSRATVEALQPTKAGACDHWIEEEVWTTDGTFPDWTQIVPAIDPDRPSIAINARYLRDVCDLAIAVQGKPSKHSREPEPFVIIRPAPTEPGRWGQRFDIPAPRRGSGETPSATVVIMAMHLSDR